MAKDKDIYKYSSDEELFECLRDDIFDNLDKAKKNLDFIIKNRNLINICINLLKNKFDVWGLLEILIRLKPNFKCKTDELVTFCSILYEKTKKDFCANKQYEVFELIITNNIENIEEIRNVFENINEEFSSDYIATIYRVLFQSDKNVKENLLKKVIGEKKEFLVCGYLSTLIYIAYNSDDIDDIVDVFISLYKNENSNNINPLIVRGLGKLITKSKKIPEFLISIKNTPYDIVRYQLARTLNMKYEDINDKDYFEILLLSCADINVENRVTLSEIDWVLYKLLNDGKSDLCFTYMINWLESSDYKLIQNNLNSIFNHTFSCFSKDLDNTKKMVVKLLNYDNENVISLGVAIVNECKKQEILFTKDDISELDENDVLYISKKVIAHFIDFKTLFNLMFQIVLYSYSKSKEYNYDIIQNYFIKFIAYNFPEQTLDELLIKVEENPEINNEILKIISLLEDLVEQSKISINTKELSISNEKFKKVRLAESEKFVKASSKLPENSLLNFIKRIPVKYSNGTFQYYNGYSDIAHMHEFKTSFSIPLSSSFMPLQYDMQRFEFQRVRKG